MKDITTILKKPLITEKGTMLKESANKVIFAVDKNANKIEIKAAVEGLYNVHVTDVQTIVVKGKAKRFGRHEYQRPDWKKAVVTLKTGDSIEFYEGV
jgi:large subunit ribosomal protein L23